MTIADFQIVPKATECSLAFNLRAAMLDVRWSLMPGLELELPLLTTWGYKLPAELTSRLFWVETNGLYDAIKLVKGDALVNKFALLDPDWNWCWFWYWKFGAYWLCWMGDWFDDDDEKEGEEIDDAGKFDELLIDEFGLFDAAAAAHQATAAIGFWPFANLKKNSLNFKMSFF